MPKHKYKLLRSHTANHSKVISKVTAKLIVMLLVKLQQSYNKVTAKLIVTYSVVLHTVELFVRGILELSKLS